MVKHLRYNYDVDNYQSGPHDTVTRVSHLRNYGEKLPKCSISYITGKYILKKLFKNWEKNPWFFSLFVRKYWLQKHKKKLKFQKKTLRSC